MSATTDFKFVLNVTGICYEVMLHRLANGEKVSEKFVGHFEKKIYAEMFVMAAQLLLLGHEVERQIAEEEGAI